MLQDLIAGNIQFAIDTVPGLMSFITSGTLTLLLISTWPGSRRVDRQRRIRSLRSWQAPGLWLRKPNPALYDALPFGAE
jgi:hypothetical protein